MSLGSETTGGPIQVSSGVWETRNDNSKDSHYDEMKLLSDLGPYVEE